MNLIEKLGGYELAKQVFDSVPKDGNSYNVTRDDTGASFHSGEIFKALLEYRRQHNIFEVGDKVVVRKSVSLDVFNFNYMAIHTIEKSDMIRGIDAVVLDSIGYAYIPSKCVSHATEEEIKAGHRL